MRSGLDWNGMDSSAKATADERGRAIGMRAADPPSRRDVIALIRERRGSGFREKPTPHAVLAECIDASGSSRGVCTASAKSILKQAEVTTMHTRTYTVWTY